MTYPNVRLVFDRKKTASKSHTGLLQIEVLFKNKRKFISTGVKLYAGQWDRHGRVVNRLDCLTLNDSIATQLQHIQEFITQLMRDGEPFTFAALEQFLQLEEGTANYIDYIEHRLEHRRDIRESSKKTQRKLIGALRAFGGIVKFADLTHKNIMAFDSWLHDRGICQATVHSYHKINKTYIHSAMRDGLLDRDPYTNIHIEIGRSKSRKYLTEGELAAVEGAAITLPTIERVRDLFIIQCYTGLAYADLMSFDFTKAVERGGKYVIADKRQKSQEDYYIVLLSPVVKILQKYNFVLPRTSNQQYNLRLKVLADIAGIDKPLTSHMGRHTFAVMALNAGAKLHNVSKMLGHTKIETTQIYAKVLNKAVEREFDMLEQRLIQRT